MYKKSSITHQFAFSFLALVLLVFVSGCSQVAKEESELKGAGTNDSVSKLEPTDSAKSSSEVMGTTKKEEDDDDDDDIEDDDNVRAPALATGTKVPVKPTTTTNPVAANLTGSFSETASYGTPAGTQTVTFSFKLSTGTITDVTLTGAPQDSTSQEYTNAFMSGITPMIVGKKLSTIGTFSRVNGTSLTANAFNKAITQLKAKA